MDPIRQQLFRKKGDPVPEEPLLVREGTIVRESSLFVGSNPQPHRNCVYLHGVGRSDLLCTSGGREVYASVGEDVDHDPRPTTIMMGQFFREHLGVQLGAIVQTAPCPEVPLLAEVAFQVGWAVPKHAGLMTTEDEVIEALRRHANETILNLEQTLPVNVDKKILKCQVKDLGPEGYRFGRLTEQTVIHLIGDCLRPTQFLKIQNLSFEETGVGGLDLEVEEILRRCFLTRMIPKRLRDKLGIKHTKGALLYGPPGTGKTLVARMLAEKVNCSVQVVNGPSLLSKFVGESEQNVRRLFEPAIADPESFHIVILDELDSLCKSRSGGSQSVHSDSIVTQLLSMIDGVNAISNIFLIGMTNRKDLIDDAMLRPGRLEVHVEIGLPSEEGRYQIFLLKTRQLREHQSLAPEVDLRQLAAQTTNMTGAEIESVVKEATTQALRRLVDFSDMTASSAAVKEITVTAADFTRTLQQIVPAFGNNQRGLKTLLDDTPFHLERCPLAPEIIQDLRAIPKGIHRVLVKGIGKTMLSAYIAHELKLDFTRYLSAIELVQASESEKVSRLVKMFTDACKVEQALLIIDDVDIISDWVPPHHFNNRILQTLKALLGTPVTNGRLLVVLNVTDYDGLYDKGLFNRVDHLYELPDFPL